MLRLTPSRISPELARQDYDLAVAQYRAAMEGYCSLDRDSVGRFRAARDRRDTALANLLESQAAA